MSNSSDKNTLPNPDGVDLAFASLPCDIDAVPALSAEIAALGQLGPDLDRNTRLEFLEKARSLVRALEAPRETMLKHVGGQTATFFSLNLGHEIGLFKQMCVSPESSQSVTELAAAVGCEVDFLARIMRHLGAMGYISQTGPDTYKPTNFTRAMAIPLIADGYPMYANGCLEPMIHFPKWLKINGYRSPTSIQGNPQMFGHTTDKPFFEWMRADEQYIRQFNHHMGGYRLGRPAWMDLDVYPVEKNLLNGFEHPENSSDPALLIDIGGSYGHDLEEFHQKFPNAPGRLVLQDLPHVLDQITRLDETIHRMPHSFLTPQPVKGARAYYLHQIMHDYPDERCVEIVEQIKSAMTPGYSRLLINEHIIPPTKASWEATYLDLYMMVMLSARERTQDDWRRLLEDRCGLKILGFYDPGHGVEGIIECELSK
ncbi:S-adenosyl-L-methionine-dependent methyltransferase [Penicillium capsulatum]|uniref:S-adenosyl-L-methionine-dependent methyltransferase n=1 Tax=Penicillium capsulatum TaxID=69766 RepID=A0A9W9LW95_9EURO|nr:S-adenosyl-L-methionine-dependent methyltransferase [Penicillium capsulatum]KAJ6121806.1 S-adenosyl-L-methionine-dependent methyltransferase [Penicillium capsulatum]